MKSKQEIRKIEILTYKERLKWIWSSFLKLKKTNAISSGDPEFDLEILKICGGWWYKKIELDRCNCGNFVEGDLVKVVGGCHPRLLGQKVEFVRVYNEEYYVIQYQEMNKKEEMVTKKALVEIGGLISGR